MRQEKLVRRCLYSLLAIGLLAAAITARSAELTTHELSSTLLADTGGSISSVVISVNSARRAALRNADLVSNIVNGLPASTRVYIFANDLSAFTVAKNPWPDRIEFVEIPFSNPITIWTQDPFLVLKSETDPQKTTLLMSREFERAGDDLMAQNLADAAGYTLKRSELYFEGGNVVSDEKFTLIGGNTIRYNAIAQQIEEAAVVEQFQRELNRQVLVVGPVPQPVAHIDMAITPMGQGRIAIADAKMGIRIAQQALDSDPASIEAFETYCEEHFFGHPSITKVKGQEGEEISAPQLRGKTRELLELNSRVAPILDGIASSLENFGYTITRIPFFFGGPESRDLTEEDGEEESQEASTGTVAAFPMLTYNNVLLEMKPTGNTAFIPRYGWPAMDNAAEQAWQAAGFKTRAIEGLTISAMYGGALRCSVKVLEKE